MSNSFGKIFKISVFGESHSDSIGVLIEGVPPGTRIDKDSIREDLDRRRPGKSKLESQRREEDDFKFLSGVLDSRATGSPISAIIKNKDVNRKDYEKIKDRPRPSHADYPAYLKYQGYNDSSGGGQFSARLTAPIVLAGSIAKSILKGQGIEIVSRIKSIYNITDKDIDYVRVSYDDFAFTDKYFPVIGDEAMARMKEAISNAKDESDSLGGQVESFAFGLPVGLGEPLFDSMESRISSAIFSIPGVRSIEFGTGAGASQMLGSDHNDPYYMDGDKVKTRTNHHGGIIGGLTTSMPLVFTTSLKPTPSIGIHQETVSLKRRKDDTIQLRGRHDPCFVPRAIPVIDAWLAICILDFIFLADKTKTIF